MWEVTTFACPTVMSLLGIHQKPLLKKNKLKITGLGRPLVYSSEWFFNVPFPPMETKLYQL